MSAAVRHVSRACLQELVEAGIQRAQVPYDTATVLSEHDADRLRQWSASARRCAVGSFDSCPAGLAGLFQAGAMGWPATFVAGTGRFAMAFDAAVIERLGHTSELVIDE